MTLSERVEELIKEIEEENENREFHVLIVYGKTAEKKSKVYINGPRDFVKMVSDRLSSAFDSGRFDKATEPTQ